MPNIEIEITSEGPRSLRFGASLYYKGKTYSVDGTEAEKLLRMERRGAPLFRRTDGQEHPGVPRRVRHRFTDSSGQQREEWIDALPAVKSSSSEKKDSSPFLIPENEVPPHTIVIPMYNHADLTVSCLESLGGPCEGRRVLVVDDGSLAPFAQDGADVLRHEENLGFVRSVNDGVAAADTPFVVLLNNDVVLKPDAVRMLLSALRDPKVGIAGAKGGTLPKGLRRAGRSGNEHDYVEMSCCAFRRSVWEKLGGLDSDFGRGYFEDADFGWRLRRGGYQFRVVEGCCTHIGGATFGRGRETLDLLGENRELYRRKHWRGRCLWVMAAAGINGGCKVIHHMASAMQDDGWDVSVCSFTRWDAAPPGWKRFNLVGATELQPPYDLVVSSFHSTMPFARDVECRHRIALIQSDEPEWGPDKSALRNFKLDGFRHVIIADHMRGFADKYGMDIAGQIENGVDSAAFFPHWYFERPWPHRVMLIRKGAPVWFAGQRYAEEAVFELSRRYREFEAVVLGGDKPDWPFPVRHVRTFDEQEICGLLNSVSCMIIPSLIEGSSLVALEALASGTPLVTTRVGVDYGVDGENCLFVPDKDSGAIVEAVSRVFDEPELRARLVRNGLKLAHTRTWGRERAQWLEVVNREMEGDL